MWSLFAAFVLVALLVDFFAMSKQGAHRVSTREAATWSLVWVGVSFVFMGWLWWHLGSASADEVSRWLAHAKSLEFLTGYLIEKALAVDNIFVFLMLFTCFAVPAEFQKRVLKIGILGALVLRAAMILVGDGPEPDLDNNPALKWIRSRFKTAPGCDGEKFFTVVNGVKMASPLLVVILLIGIVDIVFAVDSIPAIFAITTDPFILLTSNVFAILGLRAMYFLLANMHERFHLLSYGLAIARVFIGAKMLLIDVYKIPVVYSLGFTAITLAVTMILSLKIPPKGKPGGVYPFGSKNQDERA